MDTDLDPHRQTLATSAIMIRAAFFAPCQIEDQVDLQLQDGQIVIKPLQRMLRIGTTSTPASARQRDAAPQSADQFWQTH